MDALARFAWFLVAASVGVAWVSAAKWSGGPLETHAHGVFLTLFVAALTAGGHDVRALYRFKDLSRKLAADLRLSPEQLEDAERLAAAVVSRDPDAVQDELDRLRKPRTGRNKTTRKKPDRPQTRPGDLPLRRDLHKPGAFGNIEDDDDAS